jgi:hypothetical protein
MPSTLENFTLSAIAASNDFIVGYDTAALNGERRWTVSTIANAVSGIMTPQLNTSYFSSSGFAMFYPPENAYTFESTTFLNWVRIDFGTTPVGSPKPPLNARFAYCRLIGDTNSAQALTMYSRSVAGGGGYVVSSGFDQSSDYMFLPIYNNGIDIYASGASGTGWSVTAFGYLL